MTGEPCVDLTKTDEILAQYPAEEPSLIQVLQDVHRAYNYLPCDVLTRVSEALGGSNNRLASPLVIKA